MAVDLGDLIEDLRAEVNPPGSDLFPDATDDDWVTRLRNAFWEARLGGAFVNYREADGLLNPIQGTVDLPREAQQLIILFAGLQVVLTEYRNVQATFRAQAGPVQYETGKSAQLLKSVLDAIRARIQLARETLLYGVGAEIGGVVNIAAFDAVIARTDAQLYRDTWFVR